MKVFSEEVSENGLENHNTADRRALDVLRGCAVAGRLGRALLLKPFNRSKSVRLLFEKAQCQRRDINHDQKVQPGTQRLTPSNLNFADREVCVFPVRLTKRARDKRHYHIVDH